ncbi:MAG: ABC transporter family substrate-binding protein, partial [Microbacteriaceae bacterium]|nr:ABC transporter family substrate-binding protein [Microbacteriaceae bacterium]
ADARVRSSHVFLPGTDDYTEAAEDNGSADYRRPDLAGAKRLLRQAGALAPEVCILFDPANPRRLSEFDVIQSAAAKAGFRVTDCSSPTWQELLGVPGQYDASLYALRASNLAVTAARASFASTGGANNTSFYSNAAVDALLAELDGEPDAAEQSRILADIDRLVWADAAGMPLYQFPSITAFRTGVTGVTPSPLAAGVLWNVWDWKPTR